MRRLADDSWVVHEFPELLELPDTRERWKIWKEAVPRVWGTAYCLGFLIGWMGVLLMTKRCESAICAYLPRGVPALLVTAPPYVAAPVFAMRFVIQRGRRRIEYHVRQRLRDWGKPICMGCGYNLHGQTDARCPECGTPFDLSLLKHENTGASHE